MPIATIHPSERLLDEVAEELGVVEPQGWLKLIEDPVIRNFEHSSLCVGSVRVAKQTLRQGQ